MYDPYVERALWRWTLVFVVLGCVYLMARSGRYVQVSPGCQASGQIAVCPVLDHWTGDVVLRKLDRSRITQSR